MKNKDAFPPNTVMRPFCLIIFFSMKRGLTLFPLFYHLSLPEVAFVTEHRLAFCKGLLHIYEPLVGASAEFEVQVFLF